MFAVLAVLPVILVILTGFLAARSGMVQPQHWAGVQQLTYRVLIPAIMIGSIWQSDLGAERLGLFVAALILSVSIAGLGVLALYPLARRGGVGNPSFTTLFQVVTRWDAFIALTLALRIAGEAGVALIAVGMAFMIPFINIANVFVLVALGPAQASARQVAMTIAGNPLVQGAVIGLALNLTGVPQFEPVIRSLDMIGRASLSLGILVVGAAIHPRRLLKRSAPLMAGVGLRMLICPLIFITIGAGLGLSREQLLIGTIAFAVPAASNGYIVAQQMGGDAGLYADVLTWQLIIGALTLPAIIWVLA